jgi:gamma-glutamyltranspeptidase/glutathione hydrolase
MGRRGRLFYFGGACALVLLALLTPPANAAGAPAAAIASSHPAATAAGFEVLDQGGNAFDAAVAVAAALGVADPANSGLGGGGFWLLRRADGFQTFVDGRERAPLKAARDMYLGADGAPIARATLDGALAAAIPGTPAALAHVSEKYGRLGLERALAPAIRLAREGFALEEHYRPMLARRLAVLSPAAAEVFLDHGEVPPAGQLIRQPDLAATLERLAAEGHAGFYQGTVAARLVAGVRAGGGIWSEKDLAAYQVVERAPLTGEYRGLRIITAPPPSSGGVALLQMLGMLGGYDLERLERTGRDRLTIEAMRRAYRDRARHLGDPDFVAVNTAQLLNANYIKRLRRELSGPLTTRARKGAAPEAAGAHTTHFSVLDREGNLVAATLTLNTHLGSGFMPPGSGVLLNNEMDDFSIKPGAPNAYGLVGGAANAIAPGKRPLSSMTPTFLDSGEWVAALGTPGGSRIISMMLLATLEAAHGRGALPDWLARSRFHHQYLPDEVQHEAAAFDDDEVRQLTRMGYRLRPLEADYGNMQAVLWDKKRNRVTAASDPRGTGSAEVR